MTRRAIFPTPPNDIWGAFAQGFSVACQQCCNRPRQFAGPSFLAATPPPLRARRQARSEPTSSAHSAVVTPWPLLGRDPEGSRRRRSTRHAGAAQWQQMPVVWQGGASQVDSSQPTSASPAPQPRMNAVPPPGSGSDLHRKRMAVCHLVPIANRSPGGHVPSRSGPPRTPAAGARRSRATRAECSPSSFPWRARRRACRGNGFSASVALPPLPRARRRRRR
jgi:hypothetical protein